MLRAFGMPDADMAESIDNAFMRQDVIGIHKRGDRFVAVVIVSGPLPIPRLDGLAGGRAASRSRRWFITI